MLSDIEIESNAANMMITHEVLEQRRLELLRQKVLSRNLDILKDMPQRLESATRVAEKMIQENQQLKNIVDHDLAQN